MSISTASRRIAVGASVARKHLRIFAAWPGVRLPGDRAAIFVIDSGAARIDDGLRAERPVVDRGSSIAPANRALGAAAGADPERLFRLERLIQLVQENGHGRGNAVEIDLHAVATREPS